MITLSNETLSFKITKIILLKKKLYMEKNDEMGDYKPKITKNYHSFITNKGVFNVSKKQGI